MCQSYDNAKKIDVSLKLEVLRFCAFNISHIKNNLTISEMALPSRNFLCIFYFCVLFVLYFSILSY